MNSALTAEEHFRRGVDLFNSGEFFEAHEEMEEAMNSLPSGEEGDWDFFLGLLRAAVANHKLSQGACSSAILHLKAALKFLGPFPDRHYRVRLREFRHALSLQLARLESGQGGADASAPVPKIEVE